MEKLFKILEEVRPDIDFKIEKKLIDDGILDSFDIVSIISELNDEFDISIRVTELNAENMNSAESMFVMIKRLQGKV
jgi:D-alanine--poly(phosphoribitol) ligase subunit 2